MRRHLSELWRCFDPFTVSPWAKLTSIFAGLTCDVALFSLQSQSFSTTFGFICARVSVHLWMEPTDSDMRATPGQNQLMCFRIFQRRNRNTFPAWFRYSDRPHRHYRRPWCHIIQEHQRNDQKHQKRQSNQALTGCDRNMGRKSNKAPRAPPKIPCKCLRTQFHQLADRFNGWSAFGQIWNSVPVSAHHKFLWCVS